MNKLYLFFFIEIILVFVFGTLYWLEYKIFSDPRKRNLDYFDFIWFSMITQTSVGYMPMKEIDTRYIDTNKVRISHRIINMIQLIFLLVPWKILLF